MARTIDRGLWEQWRARLLRFESWDGTVGEFCRGRRSSDWAATCDSQSLDGSLLARWNAGDRVPHPLEF